MVSNRQFRNCEGVDYDTPRIDTAGRFESTWYGSVRRTEDGDPTEYDLRGESIPAAEELIVHIHGWQNDVPCGIDCIQLASDAYDDAMSGAVVTGLTWDSDSAWWSAKEIADRTAPKLAAFLRDYKRVNPDATIRLQGHSLGARLLCETLLELDESDDHGLVTTAVFFAGAVVDTDLSQSGRYGQAIERTVAHAENYWNESDSLLKYAFRTSEWSWAIGNRGCKGQPPANYTDHDVSGAIDAHWDEEYLDGEFLSEQVIPTFIAP